MAERVSDVENWKSEATGVINDIKNHVKHVVVSDGSLQLIHLNLTTIEGETYCIELSASGFRVVGRGYGEKNIAGEEYYETPYSLLNKISPQFRSSFENELFDKLSNLN